LTTLNSEISRQDTNHDLKKENVMDLKKGGILQALILLKMEEIFPEKDSNMQIQGEAM